MVLFGIICDDIGYIRGIRYLQEAGVIVTSRVTIHRKNMDDLEGIAHLLLDELGMRSISTNNANYIGLAREFQEEVNLTPADFSDTMERIVHPAEKYSNRITAAAGPLSLGKA